jgi:hypothetical protein
MSELLPRIAAILFPVFAIAAIGFVYGRYQRPDMAVANRLNMDLFVPFLILSALASESFDLSTYRELALGALAVILGSGLLVYPFARWLKVDPKTFVPPLMFNNSGNMGIPVAVLAFGEPALGAAVVLFLVEMVLHFSLGIYLLDHRLRLASLLRMPVMIATLIGLAISFSGWEQPKVFSLTLDMLADVAIPLLLFSLGVRLNAVPWSHWRLGVWAAVLSPASGLAVVWLVSLFLQLPPLQQSLLVLFGALPPAVLNFLIAEQYRQEPDKVAAMVMLGNLGSVVVLPLALILALT